MGPDNYSLIPREEEMSQRLRDMLLALCRAMGGTSSGPSCQDRDGVLGTDTL